MSLQRGDFVLATLPFVTRPDFKLRPVLVVQNDTNNAHMQNTIVAFITTNLSRSHLPTQVLIEVNTPAGQQSGLIADSVVSCGRGRGHSGFWRDLTCPARVVAAHAQATTRMNAPAKALTGCRFGERTREDLEPACLQMKYTSRFLGASIPGCRGDRSERSRI
jgi:mRNA-degrading endonuclease toxin of MazEF toxin-antitoxin module